MTPVKPSSSMQSTLPGRGVSCAAWMGYGLRWWWLEAVLLAPVLWKTQLERMAILIAVVFLCVATLRVPWRAKLAAVAAALLLGCVLSLGLHFASDDFQMRYVWLYSAPELPVYLKLANIWGGDEGTLLLLATMMAVASTRLVRHPGWTAPTALLITAVFAVGTLVWEPFARTPDADLARVPSQGMNAHLTSIWMAFHPPLVFVAYVLVLAPTGAALEALARGTGPWAVIVQRYARTAWLILSAGLLSGMWWAYEDFSFGQFWHWDPVQTSVFLVWALLSATLHGLRIYDPGGPLARALPALYLLAAFGVLVSMAVTRNEVLASSHRYIGFTSLPLLVGLGVTLVTLTLTAYGYSLRRRFARVANSGESVLMLRLAVCLFTLTAVVAAAGLVQAYVSAMLGLPRPDELKPFFETLARWSDPDELATLRRAFEQWDVDNFGMNRWLAPLGVLLGLLGGHAFLRLERRRLGWAVTGGVGLLAFTCALLIHPFDTLYDGTGMTSHNTVAIFFWLDLLLVSSTYLAVSAAVWLCRMAWRHPPRRFFGYHAPVGFAHLGVMVALIGAVSASVLDSYAQRVITFPQDYGRYQPFPDGYQVRIDMQPEDFAADGARVDVGARGFRAVAEVSVRLQENNDNEPLAMGNVLYRDTRAPAAGTRGPIRQLCEILDFRYARYESGPANMLDPFIYRGLLRDLQVWVPPVDYDPDVATDPSAAMSARQPTELAVVVKTYPLISWLWIGLAMLLLGSAVLTLGTWFPRLFGQSGTTETLDDVG